MKKILAFTLSIILTTGAFTGCGKSAEELDDIAETMLKAGCSALTNLEDDDVAFCYDGSPFYIDSEGEVFGICEDKGKERFIKEYKTFFKDLDKYYWIAGIDDYKVTEVYVAESEKSEIIGTYQNNFDVTDKSVSNVKSEISEWAKIEELKGTPLTMLKAGNSAFVDLDEEDISFGRNSTFYLDSKGEVFGNYDGKYKDEFLESFKNFFNDLDKYYWVVGINNSEVLEVYVAESEDSDTIYAYGSDLDISDMSVSDLKGALSVYDNRMKYN